MRAWASRRDFLYVGDLVDVAVKAATAGQDVGDHLELPALDVPRIARVEDEVGMTTITQSEAAR